MGDPLVVAAMQHDRNRAPQHKLDEKFQEGAVRKLVEQTVNTDDPRFDDLVKAAMTSYDMKYNQISDEGDKAEVLMEVKKQFQAGDPCMHKLAQTDEALGYGFPF